MPGGGPDLSAPALQTVADQVLKLRGHFGLGRMMPVGDRGLPVEVRIKRLNCHPGPGRASALRVPRVRPSVGIR